MPNPYTHYPCLACPPDKDDNDVWHYRPEVYDTKRGRRLRRHYVLTNIIRENLLASRWGMLSRREQRMVFRAILTRANMSVPEWLTGWIEEDHQLRQGLMLPAGTDAWTFLTSIRPPHREGGTW